MIRRIGPRDLPVLKAMERGFAWTFGGDLLECLVLTDEQDVPLMAMGAWSRAEVHMLTGEAETPGMRFSMLKQLHAAMETQLAERGVGEVVTWVDETKPCSMWRAFRRRLSRLGWKRSTRTSWHREVAHGKSEWS